eukprot:5186616-Alexandrium_andersonii.AAC.1
MAYVKKRDEDDAAAAMHGPANTSTASWTWRLRDASATSGGHWGPQAWAEVMRISRCASTTQG